MIYDYGQTVIAPPFVGRQLVQATADDRQEEKEADRAAEWAFEQAEAEEKAAAETPSAARQLAPTGLAVSRRQLRNAGTPALDAPPGEPSAKAKRDPFARLRGILQQHPGQRTPTLGAGAPGGVPMWVWVTGGVLVLAGGAYILTMRR